MASRSRSITSRDGRLLERLAPLLQVLAEADRGLLHLLVRFRRAADQNHLLGAGDPLVAVLAVEPDADDTGHRRLPAFFGVFDFFRA